MAAVTGTIIALGGLGLSTAQAIKQNKAMKTAEAASQKASNELKNISEQNAFKQLQVPTLGTNLAQQTQAQREQGVTNMLQQTGAEGVIGGVGQLVSGGVTGDLQNAARLDDLKFERDAMQAQAQQGINSRKQQREYEIGLGEKSDAEARRAQAEKNRNAAIESAVSSAGSALTSASKLVPLYKENKVLRSEANKLMAAGDVDGANKLLNQIGKNKTEFKTEEDIMAAIKDNPELLEKLLKTLKETD